MKNFLLNFVICAISCFSVFSGNCQPNLRFYISIDDYINNTPLKGYEIEPDTYKNKSFKVKVGEHIVKMKESEFPTDLFTYDKQLIRNVNGTFYIVLAAGRLCFYAVYHNNESLYYSETIKGKPMGFSAGDLKKYLKQYDLMVEFNDDHPKREFDDSVNDFFNKKVRWYVKYFNLVNEKLQ